MVNWEDGQLIQGPYVEINGTQYPVVMPEYSGNTPITAENLNKMQFDLQNEIVNLQTQMNKIVESGSNENGTYIKYADGTMICYGRANILLKLDIAYGSAYRSTLKQITLPETFIDTNYRTFLQGLAPIHTCYTVDDGKTENLFKFYAIGFVSQATEAIRSVEFVAIGKWK